LISPTVAPALAEARERVDTALRHRALRRHGGQVAAEAQLRAAVASAALRATVTSWTTCGRASVTDPVVQGGAARRRGRRPGSSTSGPRARQVLAKLHVLAARGVIPDGDLGRLTSGAERIDALAALVAGNDRTPPLLLARDRARGVADPAAVRWPGGRRGPGRARLTLIGAASTRAA